MKTKSTDSAKKTPVIKIAPKLTKEEIRKLKTTRRLGVKNLKNHLKNIRKNIKVFQQAINKERNEIKQTKNMIKVLEKDIKNVNVSKKKLK